MNFSWKVLTICGKVAENAMICGFGGRTLRTFSTTGPKSTDRSLSASSRARIWHLLRSAIPLLAKSRTLPGVPTSTWIVEFNRRISSLRLVPPVETIDSTFKCLPSSFTTADTCNANSLVGTKINAILNKFVSPFSMKSECTLNHQLRSVNKLENWNHECSCFAGSVLGSRNERFSYFQSEMLLEPKSSQPSTPYLQEQSGSTLLVQARACRILFLRCPSSILAF